VNGRIRVSYEHDSINYNMREDRISDVWPGMGMGGIIAPLRLRRSCKSTEITLLLLVSRQRDICEICNADMDKSRLKECLCVCQILAYRISHNWRTMGNASHSLRRTSPPSTGACMCIFPVPSQSLRAKTAGASLGYYTLTPRHCGTTLGGRALWAGRP